MEKLMSIEGLAKAMNIDKEFFQCSDNSEEKILSLVFTMANAFNDLKGILFWYSSLDDEERRLQGDSLAIRQVKVIKNQVYRHMISHCLECINFLRVNSHHLASNELRLVRQSLGAVPSEAWQVIDRILADEDQAQIFPDVSKAALMGFLRDVRNKATFHFDDIKTMLEGLEPFKNDVSDPAEISYGSSLESTRFFFADSVSAHFVFSKAKQHGVPDVGSVAVSLIQVFHRAFPSFVARYLEQRQDSLSRIARPEAQGKF